MILVAFAVLSLIAMASVGAALRGRVPAGRGAAERAIFTDQILEIDRDEARGLIGAEEAKAARTEIQRRLVASLKRQERGVRTSGSSKTVVVLLALTVPVSAVAFYITRGAPMIPSVTLTDRAEERQRAQDVAALAAQLKARLEAEADGGRSDGWVLLGQTYLRMERFEDAAEAFAVVTERTDATSVVWSLYAEALILAEEGRVTPEAQNAAERAYTLDPMNPAASYYSALALEQAGQPEEAHDLLLERLGRSPEMAPWKEVFAAQANRIAESLGRDPVIVSSAPAAPGPSAADVEAAADMTTEDRAAFIRSMVARLAARMEETPEDIDGWMRLGNAYRVLGEIDESRAAYLSAQALLAGRPDDPRRIEVEKALSEF